MATTLNDFETAYGTTLEEWISLGGPASSFMEKYNSWKEDPIAFHQTQPIPYFAIYNEMATFQEVGIEPGA